MKTLQAKTYAQTATIAHSLANLVKTGDVLALYGNLGAGKTAFCRCFIQHVTESNEEVPSPTFTLLQTYEAPNFDIYHFDLYRLEKPQDVYELGIEDALIDGVTLIEWPEKMGQLLPSFRCLTVQIDVKDDVRTFTFSSTDASWNERLNKWHPIL